MSKKIHVRPGKTQSKAGFIVGIIFCLIGIVVVIPTFGPFGILWTAAAGWIAYSHYRNGFTDKPISTQVIEVEGDGEDITVTTQPGFGTRSYTIENERSEHAASEKEKETQESVEERLRKLQSLYDQMLITREEYEAKKKDILEDL